MFFKKKKKIPADFPHSGAVRQSGAFQVDDLLPAAQTCRRAYSLSPPPTPPTLSAQISEAFALAGLKRFTLVTFEMDILVWMCLFL